MPNASKVYTKDVVCLFPLEGMSEDIPIPRGAKRARLSEMGLIGKVSINSSWKVGNVTQEVSSVFASAFNLPYENILSFDLLRYSMYREVQVYGISFTYTLYMQGLDQHTVLVMITW